MMHLSLKTFCCDIAPLVSIAEHKNVAMFCFVFWLLVAPIFNMSMSVLWYNYFQ